MTVITLLVVLAGVAVSWLLFGRRNIPDTAPAGERAHALARADLYGDLVNEKALMAPGVVLTEGIRRGDRSMVDGTAMGIVGMVGGLSSVFRRMQNGYVRTYALTMFAGAALVTLSLVLVRMS